ncbi:hypothetical protein [Kyrpidia tusciae]|uniref:Uncharacterized protein n=1 Tax=Kyrpidia tusciae (strain DSM 2912 / NBRC 15312 / T2) TaxID=562970 RepID=D5WRD5_KYRT2|nr:hypothetical protein [Kyrpidia tusciae]ADG06865.1 conserved hypothetical protein [Kyrpidia tusciae DSM 2912]
MAQVKTLRDLERQKDEVMEMYLFASPEDRVKLLLRHMELQESIDELTAAGEANRPKPVRRWHRRRRVWNYL